MHLIGIASLTVLLVQIFCVIHALHKGYPHSFVMMVLSVPLVGAIGYLIIEFGPALYYSHIRNALKKIRKTDPQLELVAKRQAALITPTVENGHTLAKCYLSLNEYEQALILLDDLLKNQFSHDPYLMLDKAKALFGLKKYNEAKFVLDNLQNQTPAGYSNYAEAHLLYARSLVALGETHLANREFERLQQYYIGLEASYYYLQHLRQLNHETLAEEVLRHMHKRLHRLPKHYQRKELSWLKQAQKD